MFNYNIVKLREQVLMKKLRKNKKKLIKIIIIIYHSNLKINNQMIIINLIVIANYKFHKAKKNELNLRQTIYFLLIKSKNHKMMTKFLQN